MSLLVVPVILGSIKLDIVEVCPPTEVMTAQVESTAFPSIVVMVEKVMVVGVALFTVTHMDSEKSAKSDFCDALIF